MEIIGIILFIIGVIISFIYGIKLIIIAFQESILWGLLYLFLPFANLYFIITRWEKCGDSVFKILMSIPFLLIGAMLGSMQ